MASSYSAPVPAAATGNANASAAWASDQAADMVLQEVQGPSGQPGESRSNATPYYVYVVPGNPGLIDFYRPFVDALGRQLRRSRDLTDTNAPVRIGGRSLAGFEAATRPVRSGNYNLAQTIAAAETDIQALGGRVVLVGHSVGGYIVMELLRRQAEKLSSSSASSSPSKLIGGILVFPTLTEIARSPNGLRLTPFLTWRPAPWVAFWAVRLLLWLWPAALVAAVMRYLKGFPAPAAESAALLAKTPSMVKQVVWLAGNEMQTIRTDTWSTAVWDNDEAPLFLYYGENDHWVPNDARDALVAKRGKTTTAGGNTVSRTATDGKKIPHAWPIAHSEDIAEVVAPLASQFIAQDASRRTAGKKEANGANGRA